MKEYLDPTHPGEILLDDFLKPMEISINKAGVRNRRATGADKHHRQRQAVNHCRYRVASSNDMRLIFITAMFFLSGHLLVAGRVQAADVTNLTSSYSGSQLDVEYDLVGRQGEKESCIKVSVVIDKQSYSSDNLSLSGDFGCSVKLGTKLRIVWKYLEDFPQGLKTAFKFIVDAVPNRKLPNDGVTPSEGFLESHLALNRQSVVDTRTNLMWTRNAGIFENPATYAESNKLIEKLNRERYAGYNDWRMPTREEFEALIADGKKAGWGKQFARYIADFLKTCGFNNVQLDYYWTSTTSETNENRAFAANGWNGLIRSLEKTNYYFIWPVRYSR